MLCFNFFAFGMLIPAYMIYCLHKIIKACSSYHKKRVPVIPTEQEQEVSLVDNWLADCMENPQEYDERHSCVIPYDVKPGNNQPINTTSEKINLKLN